MRPASLPIGDAMLNPTFPKSAYLQVRSSYVLDGLLARATLSGNESLDTGTEYRLQQVYGDELWRKLERAGFPSSRLTNLDILEVCASSGFLSYHLLNRCQPKSMTINDLSPKEIKSAKELLAASHPHANITWARGDMHSIVFGRKFDLVIGNSFLHHFHNVPEVLCRLATLLRQGGCLFRFMNPP